MSDLGDYKHPKPERTYISPSLDSFGKGAEKVRIASKIVESDEEWAFGTIKDEVVLRQTEGGSKKITAKFIEDPRRLFLLSIQGYSVATDKPHNASFSFIGDEIPKLADFLDTILAYGFKGHGRVNISDDELKRIAVSEGQARKLLRENEEVFSEVLRHEITREDIVSIGYRKRQLEVFGKLLADPNYFEEIRHRKEKSKEGLWQEFFEKNKWIFGYGLSYVFFASLDEKKLEQVVQGYDVSHSGKRVDALMKSRGVISALCFVELKTHATPLLQKDPYRVGCYAPSKELTEAVAQIQGTVSRAVSSLESRISLTDKKGDPTGEEAFNYQPKSYLVIGSLAECAGDYGVNQDKYRSFELFRRNLVGPEILTFDEVFERAKFIVSADES